MRSPRALAVPFILLLVIVVCMRGGRAQAPGSAIFGDGGTTFYGIGDIGGGAANSIVQDATQVGGTIYAVGASAQTATGVFALDTAVLWDSATHALTIVPDLAPFSTAPATANSVLYAITPDAQYIGGRLRNVEDSPGFSTGFKARRNLSGVHAPGGFTAIGLSDDANVLLGQRAGGNAADPAINNSRAIRFDVSGTPATSVPVPLLTPAAITPGGPCSISAPTCLDNIPAYRGLSSDGSVLVGTAFTGTFTPSQNQYQTSNGLAFRWVFNQPAVTEIPRPAGGTWSSAIAISPDGNLTLAGGSSLDYPFGEVWIHDATTNAIQELGSPNTQFSPRLWGGMTADGSVVGVTFMLGGGTQNPTFQGSPTQYAYLRNSHGWFHLANVLTAQGIDLWANGWNPTNMILTGIRTVDSDNDGTPDVDLVFGQGRRRNANGTAGAPEGFVASFAIGVLADYQPPAPAPVADTSLVGAWALGANPNDPLSVMVFMSDGTYYTTTSRVAAGYVTATEKFERGVYTLTAGGAVTFTTTEDRDGAGPSQTQTAPFVFNGLISSLNGRQSLSVTFTSADSFTVEDAACLPVCSVFQATRIAGGSGSIVGAWTTNNAPFFAGKFLVVFLGDTAGLKHFQIADGDVGAGGNDSDTGTYTFTPPSQLVLTELDGNINPVNASLTGDELGLFVDDPPNSFTLARIVNPVTVVPTITNPTLAAGGSEDAPFSYTVTAINALTFEATGLPDGLTIDHDTGVISGLPAASGTFNVTVTVTNSFGDTDTANLVLTFSASQASIRGIGDLAGGAVSSAVRDATRVNGTTYAVGASTAVATNNPPALDTPVLWSSTGGPGGTLQALPHSPLPGNPDFVSTQTDSQSAYAITQSAEYIASQARRIDTPGAPWVRVTRALLPATAANFDINVNTPGVMAYSALAISDDGKTVYGHEIQGDNTRRTTRYEFDGGLSRPPLLPGYSWSIPIPRGTSADGLVMIGAASNGPIVLTSTPTPPFGDRLFSANTAAFRYEHDAGTLTGTTSAIAFAAGGTWNHPIALSADGSVTVVAGNSSAYPNGEIYLTNAAGAVTATLGSPNTALAPRMLGGRTHDGAIAVTFSIVTPSPGQIAGLGLPAGNRLAYVRNAHGWFLLGSVLRAQGLDLEALGWNPNDMAVTGVRTVEGVDLVFGQGQRQSLNAAAGTFTVLGQEGFVIKLPAGALAAFNPPVVPPPSNAIVGAWASFVPVVPVFFPDGQYMVFTRGIGPNQSGVERGSYTWAGNGGEWYPTVRFDTNGTLGMHAFSSFFGRTLTVTGDALRIANTRCGPGVVTFGVCVLDNARVVGGSSSIEGAWRGTVPDGEFAGAVVTAVFEGPAQGGLRYFVDYDMPADEDYFEHGTYSFVPGTLTFTSEGGGSPDSASVVLSRDGLSLAVADDDVTFSLTRVVDPATVVPVITSAANATAFVGSPFSYTITADHGLTFDAIDLPAWLSLDSETGELTGLPPAPGTESVTIAATNTFGATATATLTIDVALPPQAPLGVINAPASAAYGDSFLVDTTGGSGTGGVTFATSGACSNEADGALIAMTSGTGICTITATKAGDDSYDPISSQPVSVTADRKPASVTPAAAGKTLGASDPPLTGTLDGFLAADGVSATYARAAGETAGSYVISATLSPAGVLDNYDITYDTALFTIEEAPSVQLIAPNGGERVFVGVATTIQWSSTGSLETFDLELSRNGGSTYAPIPGCVGLPSGTTSCAWTPTTPASTNAVIRVTARADTVTAADAADAPFTIVNAAPSITVTAPNTAVSWTAGSAKTITWNHNLGIQASVQIELSRDGGATWETLSASTQNSGATSGSFAWDVSGTTTSSALVRVSWLDGPASDISNVPFAIVSPAVAVTAPNTAVTWRSGTARNVTFSHNLGAGQSFDISVSRDGGVTWTPVSTFVTTSATSGSYSWMVDGPATTAARIRVAWAGDAGVFDTSDVDFTVSSRVTVTSPNTALTWAAGTTRTITWTHNLTAADVMDIAFSADGGATWTPLATQVPNTSATAGSYAVALPNVTGPGLIRVAWSARPDEFDVSNVPFTLVTPTLAVTSPNTNVNWVTGTSRNITWSHNLGTAEAVRIESSRDSGATWTTIAANVQNTAAASGTFNWIVDGPVSSAARVRVVWVQDETVHDMSDVDFRVQSTIAVTAPNTAVSWAAGSTRTVTWNHNLGDMGLFDVAASTDGGASWTALATGVTAATATTGAAVVAMPATMSAQALVRVSPAGAPDLGDVSNTFFTLAAPVVTVTAPNTNVAWVVGTLRDVRWSHNLGAAETVRLESSRDGGATWTTIAANVANTAAATGTFGWIVDGPVSSAARIRVAWTQDAAVQDVSDVDFRVQPAITVTAPNTAVSWAAGSTRTVTWNHSLGDTAAFDVAASTDGGASWTTLATGIGAATATTGTAVVSMPATVSAQALVRVSPAGAPGDGDVSNTFFTLAAPLLTVNAPNTNVNWTIGSARNITWNHNLGTAEFVVIELSRDGGASWTTVSDGAPNTGTTGGTFGWTVTGPATTAGRIRITWVADGEVSDVSNVNFRIQ